MSTNDTSNDSNVVNSNSNVDAASNGSVVADSAAPAAPATTRAKMLKIDLHTHILPRTWPGRVPPNHTAHVDVTISVFFFFFFFFFFSFLDACQI
jgi:hypothetical protein